MILSLLLTALCLLFTVPAYGAFAEVGSMRNSIASGSTADSQALAYPTNPVSGQVLCVWGAVYDAGGSPASITVSDTLTTSYNVLAKPNGGFHTLFSACGFAPSSGANTVTVDPAGSAAYMSFAIDAFTGGKVGDLADVDGDWSNDFGTLATDDITTTVSDALILGIMVNGTATASLTAGGSYTSIAEEENSVCCVAFNAVFRIVSGAAGTFTVDWTLGSAETWIVHTRSLKPSVTAPVAARRRVVVIQ